ncbi:hypothetical protein KIPB_006834, partial [Kipferlia bialata]
VAIKKIDITASVVGLKRHEIAQYVERLDKGVVLLQSLARIPHMNIAQYLDSYLDEARNEMCIVMEYVKGTDLKALISLRTERPQSVPMGMVKSVTFQLLSAVHHLHSQTPPVIHRDLKPENVLLDNNGTVKIVDFGFARTVSPHGLAETYCGSPLYMSPEIFRKEKYDEKTDIWSLGCVLYELVSGRHPFQASSMADLTHKLQAASFRKLTLESCPMALIINMMLRGTPSERPSAKKVLTLPPFSHPSHTHAVLTAKPVSTRRRGGRKDLHPLTIPTAGRPSPTQFLLDEKKGLEEQIEPLVRRLTVVMRQLDNQAKYDKNSASLIGPNGTDTCILDLLAGFQTVIKNNPSVAALEIERERQKMLQAERERELQEESEPLEGEAALLVDAAEGKGDIIATIDWDERNRGVLESNGGLAEAERERESAKESGWETSTVMSSDIDGEGARLTASEGQEPSQAFLLALQSCMDKKDGVLKLTKMTLTLADLDHLVKSIPSLPTLVTVRIGENNLGDEGMHLLTCFLRALPSPKTIRKLDLGGWNIV